MRSDFGSPPDGLTGRRGGAGGGGRGGVTAGFGVRRVVPPSPATFNDVDVNDDTDASNR